MAHPGRNTRRTRPAAGALSVVGLVLAVGGSSPAGRAGPEPDPACERMVAQLEEGEGGWCFRLLDDDEAEQLLEGHYPQP